MECDQQDVVCKEIDWMQSGFHAFIDFSKQGIIFYAT